MFLMQVLKLKFSEKVETFRKHLLLVLSKKCERQTELLRPSQNILKFIKKTKKLTCRQGRCGNLSFILYLSKKYLATVHSTVCPFSNWRGKLCICAGFLVTLQTLENGGKMLLLFGNHGYLILLSKWVFQLEGKPLNLCRFLCDVADSK